jgi:hypothetical protein
MNIATNLKKHVVLVLRISEGKVGYIMADGGYLDGSLQLK